MRYYISDLHFCHRRIKEMDNRGFNTLFEMHNYLIEQWNRRVTNNDEVFIIGDFSFGKGVETWEILNKLKGKITLIEGNHDFFFLDDKEFIDTFENVTCYSELYDDGRNVILSHYPMPFYNFQFRRDDNDKLMTYMLYGHVHNTYDEYLLHRMMKDMKRHDRTTISETIEPTPCQLINTFCAFSDYTPLTLNEWIKIDQKRRELIDQFEEKNGGNISYQQWSELNDIFLKRSKENWI